MKKIAFSITAQKINFCKNILLSIQNPIGFADVGSGGVLKEPWSLLPENRLHKFSFEPTDQASSLPLCISNREGKAKFYVAVDERGSSLHEPLQSFADRFGQDSILTQKVIDVQLITLDNLFMGKFDQIDCIDINVEGHDFQVLEGAKTLFSEGKLKLLKIEFELAPVWKEQGWFSDIDSFMRNMGYELANIEYEFSRTAQTRHIFYQGEPLWGKAYYVPSIHIWKTRLLDKDEILKGIALYTAANLIGRSFDIIDLGVFSKEQAQYSKKLISQVYKFAVYEKLISTFHGVYKGVIRRLFK